MTARLTPEREAAIRRLIAPGRLPIPEAGAAAIHWLLAELDAVREERDEARRERDLLRRHADAMAAGIAAVTIEEMMTTYPTTISSRRRLYDPLEAYRAEFPAAEGEKATTEEEKSR